MSAIINLDRPHPHFTNLDFLTGRVVLKLPSEASIAGIQVKLEGESRSRLVDNSEKRRTESEVHKILYKVANVFPTPEVFQNGAGPTSWTFAAGSYNYPFQFKVPFNNSCSPHNSMLTNLNITGLKVDLARDSNRHVKKTLPPSLTGLAGEADIRYFVKATVIRPQFYKENIRGFADLKFLPIEPPRTGKPSEEMYARRQHQFSKKQAGMRKRNLFSRKTPFLKDIGEPPVISADARLPNPPILTCNEPVPLRILVSKKTPTSESIFLQMLQIELISYTRIRAHDLERTHAGSWVITSASNMHILLGPGNDPVDTEWVVNPGLWDRSVLPSTVAPSFETCNISRYYELEVRVGFTHGVDATKPQFIVLPLRMAVKVFSGITPPPALLEAVAASGQTKPAHPIPPPRPVSYGPPIPPRPSAPTAAPVTGTADDEAPPSYEDAMAETLGPLVGPRREYNPPVTSSAFTGNFPGPGADSKTSVGSYNDQAQPTLYGNVSAHSSTESIDIIPPSPTEISESPPQSPPQRPPSEPKKAGSRDFPGTTLGSRHYH